MSERPVYIYCLRDPVSGDVGYVGSGTDVAGRAGSHFAERLWGASAKADWLRAVWAKGVKPEVVIVETVNEQTRLEAEQRWLDMFRRDGHPITNRTGRVRRHQ